MNCGRRPGQFQRVMPALLKTGAARGWGVGCGAAGAGEADSSLLLSQTGCGVKRSDGDGEGWAVGLKDVLNTELVQWEQGGAPQSGAWWRWCSPSDRKGFCCSEDFYIPIIMGSNTKESENFKNGLGGKDL